VLRERAGRVVTEVGRISPRTGPRSARQGMAARDRSLRERRKRRPRKQPGGPGMTMSLVDEPDEKIDCLPATCCGCGADLAAAPVTADRAEEWPVGSGLR
jgi:hypothetical protein